VFSAAHRTPGIAITAAPICASYALARVSVDRSPGSFRIGRSMPDGPDETAIDYGSIEMPSIELRWTDSDGRQYTRFECVLPSNPDGTYRMKITSDLRTNVIGSNAGAALEVAVALFIRGMKIDPKTIDYARSLGPEI
jgi:hypothetical protein